MKRLFSSFLLLTVMLCGAMAQPIYVYRKDAPKEIFQRSNVESIRYSKEDMDGVIHPNYVVQEFCTSEGITRIPLSAIDSVVYMPYSPSYLTCPDDHHPHAIDLGLPSGTKWACCNVGATSPEGYGGYYAWGETSEKSVYNDVTYLYYTGQDANHDGSIDDDFRDAYIGSDIAGTSYDVAHVQWGGTWIMPSLDKIKEMLNICGKEWTVFNGVSGTLVTGPNGGRIFFPAAGYFSDFAPSNVGYDGQYRSSSQDLQNSVTTYGLLFGSNFCFWDYLGRSEGQTVRAVCPSSFDVGHPDAHPSITGFMVTASTFVTNGFTYGEQTYDYKFDVSVTAEIDNLKGVEDWGYVYQAPDGNITRISLIDCGQSYTDSRYAYYRNEAHSTAIMYVYVKYKGDSEYYNGDPHNYPLDYGGSNSCLTCPDDNHPHAIDLGLPSGTKWACCNVGATVPEEHGGYYAWGETSEKSEYNWNTYTYYNLSADEYLNLESDIAGTSYDVAHVQWGDPWVMPSHERQMELLTYCSKELITVNGVNGMRVTGPNGGQIFFPVAGCRWGTDLLSAGSYGDCWSSTHSSDYSSYADGLVFGSRLWCSENLDRYYGRTVRAVCPASPIPEANPLIKDFTITDSTYAADGFTYEDQTYDYKFDVSVTAEIDNLEGVEDWGYVCQVTDGGIIRVSLMEYGQSYTDTRYAYYRNEAHSTATLYTYVKYKSDSKYYYGEPQDYSLRYTTPIVRFSCPDDHHPHAIDLGLPSGTKWACCNVGATTPEEYGGYYAWGETREKGSYDWDNYAYFDSYTGFSISIGSDIAGTPYDVAHVQWGGLWVMPSHDRQVELMEHCTREGTTVNGVNGTLVTGPSGGQIFLPAAGFFWLDYLYAAGNYCFCRSSTQEPEYPNYAYSLYFYTYGGNWGSYYRGEGQSVRAVCP